jgi:hypothetical protein
LDVAKSSLSIYISCPNGWAIAPISSICVFSHQTLTYHRCIFSTFPCNPQPLFEMNSILDLDSDFHEVVRLVTENPIFITSIAFLGVGYITLGAVFLYHIPNETKVCRTGNKWAESQYHKRRIWSYLFIAPLWALIFWLWPVFFAIVLVCTVYNRWLVNIRLPTLKLPSLRLRGRRSCPGDLEAQVSGNGQSWESIELDEIPAPAPARLANVRHLDTDTINTSSPGPGNVPWPRDIHSRHDTHSAEYLICSMAESWTPINTA